MAKKSQAKTPEIVDELGDTLSTEEAAQLEAEGEESVVAEGTTSATPPAETQEPAEPAAKAKDNRVVPFSRFDEVNERAKALDAELRTIREQNIRFEERQNVAREAQQQALQAQQQAELAAQRPDADLDPAGARAWDAEQIALRSQQQAQYLYQQLQQTQQAVQQNQANNEFAQWIGLEAQAGRQRLPDYDTRIDFARAARVKFWSMVYPEQTAKDIVANEEMAVVNAARRNGTPLSDVVTYLSNQWGYGNQPQVNGTAPRPVALQTVLPSANQRIDQIQRAQAVQGLGRVQSGETTAQAPWQTMDAKAFREFVVAMDEDKYMEMLQDPNTGRAFAKKVDQVEEGVS